MAKYVAPDGKYKRRKQQRARKMAMYSTIVLFILVLSFGIVKVIELFTDDTPDIPLLENTPRPEQTTGQSPVSYNMGPDKENMAQALIKPDIDVLRVTANGRVEISYFDDAVFMGDSLADGFKAYSQSLDLKNSGAVYLTQRSTTPKTFLVETAMVDAGRGLVSVWPVIDQRQPGKIYVTLGTNALMGADPQDIIESYSQLVDKLKERAPGATIYITTVTPTTAEKATSEPRLSFDRIYRLNNLIATMCNEKGVNLINLYEVLKNQSGYLREDLAYGDGIHLTPNGYRMWLDYLITHTVYDSTAPYVPGSPYYEII